MPTVNDLLGKTIFVDANAFLYFLGAECNELTREIFRYARLEKLSLVTSVRVVDEVLFKALLAKAREVFGIKKNVHDFLRRNKDRVKKLADVCKVVFDLLELTKVEVVEIRESTLRGTEAIMKDYGLFGNDAISLKVMRERNLKYILTSDKDFEGIKELVVINPLGDG